jgi:mono/diheme cytochrome c family protein
MTFSPQTATSWLIILLFASFVSAEPIVPGFYRLRDEAKNVNPAELGQLLIGELNCTQCHAGPIAPRLTPDLSTIGSRATPGWIRKYLTDPHKVKPGATMPDIFHASEPAARDGAVDFLTHFLVAQGGPMTPSNSEGNTILIDQGRKIYHSIGCVACHAPEQPLKDGKVPSVPHGDLAGKYTVEALSAFLLDPVKARPAGRMPSLHLSAKEAQAIATYLLRDQMNNPQLASAAPLRSPGLKYQLWDNTSFPNVELATFDTIKQTSEGTVDAITLDFPERKSQDGFGVKFTGLIAIPKAGKYNFWLRSDDGARLYIDDKLVVNNDGQHAPQEAAGEIELGAGDHSFTLTYFEWVGGETLEVSWQGPGFAQHKLPDNVLFRVGGRAMIPLNNEPDFMPDPQKVAMGGRMFAAMGCANCHSVPGLKAIRSANALAALHELSGGCLAEKPAKGLPDYDLSEEQRAFIGEALTEAAKIAPPKGEAEITHTLAAMNCYACHRRGDIGGATKDRSEFFTMLKPFDMGDEGRLPPRLSGAGNKLRPEAMEQIIFEGKLHVRRHHMATRMPQFPKERMPGLVAAMQTVDTDPKERPVPEFAESAARDGRLLVGIKGLGCINCHGVAGVPSIGMPALDLSLTTERLKPGWFNGLLRDPNRKNPATRMPAFWYEGQVAYANVAGGTVDGQIDAIWTYLSLGKSMGLPAGLQPSDAGFELIPAGEPLIHRTFMKDVGTRAILVGSPDGVHVAFDAGAVRLAKAWRGRFFDAAGSRRDRGGAFFDPLGTDVLNLPAGPSFAVLADANALWPIPKPGDRAAGAFRGYRTDKSGQITFLYRVGEVDIEESPVAVLRKNGAVLVRKFTLKGNAPAGLTFSAAAGNSIESSEPGVWKIDGSLTVRIDPKYKPIVRSSADVKQLLIPAVSGAFELEVSW